jgi:nucleotide-binding universal stress UspA family protein
MALQKILLPYDFSSYDKKALDFVVDAYGSRKDVKVTLFNAYTPVPDVTLNESPELAKMRAGMVSLTEELRRMEEGLKTAREHLLESGFENEQVDYIFKAKEKPISDEIIEAISNGHYKVLVLSRKSGKVSRLFGKNVCDKILAAAKDITVCVAT